MKSFRNSWIVVLALFVIVGGVYATWDYNKAAEQTQVMVPYRLAAKVIGSTTNGIIGITSNTLSISIDDEDKNHVGEMLVTGQLDFEFTPNAAIPENSPIFQNGIQIEYVLRGPTGLQWRNNDVFTVNDRPQQVGSDRIKSGTITADQIKNLITMRDIILPTVEDYDELAASLGGGNFTITLSEKSSPAP